MPLSRDLLSQMIAEARLTPAEVDDRLTRVVDPDYWRQLAPDFHVLDPLEDDARLELASADEGQLRRAIDGVRAEGMFALGRVLTPGALQRLNAGLDAVLAAGWPAVFAFMYDEFWDCARLPPLRRVVTETLGPNYAQIPHIWIHILRPGSGGSAGWGPHVDGLPSGRLSAWMALTAATPENGCMYAIPPDEVPDAAGRFYANAGGTFTMAEVVALLQAGRALPAAAGDILGWSFEVVHWGGNARPGAPERRAISLEFIAASEAPAANEIPVLSLDTLPSLQERLTAIAQCVLSYGKHEPLVTRHEGLARGLLDRVKSR